MARFDKSNNPFLTDKVLSASANGTLDGALIQETTTVQGAINKTFILFGVMLVTTVFSFMAPNQMLMYVGVFGAAGVMLFTNFKPHLAPITAPIFAALEGLFVGTVSAIYSFMFDGIVLQAVSLTFATLFMMLMIYKSGFIKVTSKFRTGVSMAVGAIMILYLISWAGHFIGFEIPYLHASGPIGIGITVVIIGIAALNLLLDFDSFEKAEQYGAPKYMEWFVSMGLLFTVVWLYVEFLRLLAKLQDD